LKIELPFIKGLRYYDKSQIHKDSSAEAVNMSELPSGLIKERIQFL
jgi:hypothetical protein